MVHIRSLTACVVNDPSYFFHLITISITTPHHPCYPNRCRYSSDIDNTEPLLKKLDSNIMTIKLSNGSENHEDGAAARVGEDVATNESDTANGDKSQSQSLGKVKGGKGKSKPKSKAKSDAQSKERIQRLDQLYSKKKRQTYFVPTPKSNTEVEKPGQISHVVLKVRRIICDKGFPTGTEIDISSSLLKDTLSEIYEGIEGLQLNETPIISPNLLFHAREGLANRVKAEEANPTPSKALV